MIRHLIVLVILICCRDLAHAQADTLTLQGGKRNKALQHFTTGHRISFATMISGKSRHGILRYDQAWIRRITADTIYITGGTRNYNVFDSTRYAGIDSFMRISDTTGSEAIPLSSVQRVYLDKARTLWIVLGVAGIPGPVSYFIAPFVAKTTSAGDINGTVYYSMIAYGVIGTGLVIGALTEELRSGDAYYIIDRDQVQPMPKRHAMLTVH